LSIGVEICEDLWDDTYETKVTDILVRKGAELIINISASPFVREKVAVRRKIISETAARNGVPFLYCNLLGAQDELIYDGHCLAAGKTGEIKAAGKPFASEGMEVIINDSGEPEGKVQREPETVESIYLALVLGIRDYIRKSGFSGVVLGISGGIDSALVAALAAAALGGENVTGILMPSRFSSDHSVTDAEKLAKNLGINARTVPINTLFEEYEKELSPFFSGLPFNVAEENLQARIRGNLVMAFSNKFGLLALATGNKTEFAMGYTTLYGDMCGALAPIGDLQKKLVYDISRFINEKAGYDLIPENILKKRPSAELRPDQFDPFDYDLMSPLVDEIIEHQATIEELVEKGYERELVENVFTAIAKTEFKRWQAPLILKISNYAFGIGRKMPIMNKFFGIAR
jgi:NAD+ synthase (glutamine-hydrolysing)